MENPQGPGMPYGHLEELLKENLEVAKQNNRILKRMERNALIGFIAKIVIWLIILGVPIIFLSSYLGPLMEAFMGTSSATPALFGLPSADQIQQLIELYQGAQQGQ